MKMTDCPFKPVDWSKVELEVHKGDQGEATWRTERADRCACAWWTTPPGTLPTIGARKDMCCS